MGTGPGRAERACAGWTTLSASSRKTIGSADLAWDGVGEQGSGGEDYLRQSSRANVAAHGGRFGGPGAAAGTGARFGDVCQAGDGP